MAPIRGCEMPDIFPKVFDLIFKNMCVLYEVHTVSCRLLKGREFQLSHRFAQNESLVASVATRIAHATITF